MKPGLSWPSVVASCLAVLGLAAPAGAQVRLSLQGGFAPDPLEVGVQVTGVTSAESAVRGCPGWIAEAPALVIDFSNPAGPLSFSVAAGDQGGAPLAGLVLAAPDGIFRCVPLDAMGEGVVRVDPAQSGGHRIWPSVSAPGSVANARVLVSSLGASGQQSQPPTGLQPNAPPVAGVHDLPDGGSVQVALSLAPTTAVSEIAAECWGRINPARPDAVIRLDGQRERLELRARSDSDTTMVVIGPDGMRHCNDDTYSLDPAVTLTPAMAGAYAVWVGTYDDLQGVTATLTASTAAPASGLNAAGEPAGGRHTLASGGTLDLALALAPTTAVADFAPECWGQVDPNRPDALVTLEGGAEQLEIRATSATDTTLVVVGPDGARHCNDDSSGLNPAVTVIPAPGGDYAIWVGTYDEQAGANASLQLVAGGAPEVAPAGDVQVFGGGELSLSLALTPSMSASDYGSDCWGQVRAEGPDAVIRLESALDLVQISATGPVDTTLLVEAPDGSVHCNDDTFGLDPAVTLAPAAAGDYSVRVGTFGGDPAVVTLRVSDTGGAGPGSLDLGGGFGAATESPFFGRDLPTAVAAFDILRAEEGFSEVLTYDRIEPQGDEGFILHGVTIVDPSGESPPFQAARLRVSDLDLEGLSVTGAPGRFVIALEGIDYAALAAAVNAEAGGAMPLPQLAGNPELSGTVSLLPATDDASRRVMSADVTLDGQFALAFEARMRWPEGVGIPPEVADAPTESMLVELRNFGFIGMLVQAQAAAAGMDAAAFTRLMIDSTRAMIAPIAPGSAREQLINALNAAAAAGLEQPGVLRLRLASDAPRGLDELFEGLAGGDVFGALEDSVQISYEPLP